MTFEAEHYSWGFLNLERFEHKHYPCKLYKHYFYKLYSYEIKSVHLFFSFSFISEFAFLLGD